ncbi:hypothetical protein SAMN05421766_101249 [Zobellia uliginosa]|uniref:Glycosyltransferase 2-like domain-containing protein n=1 Tax=Zobellia uliginosa TaxID=143224 RepID=A0ABY1KI86_9FLAO|nr:glycosyltransferase [Zobellia uliginosa]SIS38191.1 hypothetical protein SAMN05421766_101249 [Zobellia uliginosa]
MSETKITILVSTVDGGILRNDTLLNMPLSTSLNMVIVNQMIKNDVPLSIQRDHCKIINSKTKGLSVSRNLALNEVRSGYAIVADDDVVYVDGFEERIRQAFQKFKKRAILTFRIETPEGGFFKDYASEAFEHNARSLLKVSSIDMVLNVSELNSDVKFDEQFGLGAKYNTGENNIFLLDAHRKGLLMGYVPETIVIHPFENSGRVLNAGHLFAKGAVFRRMFGLKGLAIIIVFCIKKRKEMKDSGLNFMNGISSGIKGFFKYRNK